MLGDQIAELKGKLTGQRVLDVEGPTMETSHHRIKYGVRHRTYRLA